MKAMQSQKILDPYKQVDSNELGKLLSKRLMELAGSSLIKMIKEINY